MSLSRTAFRFAIVGLATSALYYCLLMLIVELLALDPTLASSACYIILVAFNYLMHHQWTYSVEGRHATRLGRYFCMITGGFLNNGAIMYLGVSWLDVNYLLVQAAAIAVIAAWNFALCTLWVFER